jgi:hypothetical protein
MKNKIFWIYLKEQREIGEVFLFSSLLPYSPFSLKLHMDELLS